MSLEDRAKPTSSAGVWIVLIVAALLCFTRFHCPLQEPQEARYAEIPRQMLAEGRLIVPVLHGQPYYDKPPLFYWLVMSAYTLFGVHDWAARLLSCTAAFLCVLVSYAWGRWAAGPRAALIGALILCLSPRFVQLERMVMLDGLLALWLVAAWATAHAALSGPRLRIGWWLTSAAACGLGLLTKGPVALVLVLPPLLALRWLMPAAVRPGWRALAGYVGGAAGLAAPWYVAVALRDDSFVGYFFWFHHVQRFAEPFDHAQPIWYYLPVLLLGMLPWTLLLPSLVAFLVRRDVRRPAALGLFLTVALWCLLFYSLAGCKRAYYLLPAMPPLALALGCYLDAVLPGNRALRTSWTVCATASFIVLFAAVGLQLPRYARSYSLRGQVRRHAGACADVPVVCYPRRWDSVSFYLGRSDVRAYSAEQLSVLIDELQTLPEALVFVKTGRPGASPGEDLLDRLPPTLAFEALGRQGALTVGRIVRRE